MSKQKWAVIGMGFIYPRHEKAIKKVGELKLTCDIDASKKADFTDWKKMVQSKAWEEITHVALCTPNYLHYPMYRAMKDKIVLSEKPLALSSEDIKKDDKVLTVLQLRYHPEVIKLKKNLKKGKHEVEMLISVKRDQAYWDGWKGTESKSGGILFNLGIHYFDLLIHLFGDKYKIIKASNSPKHAEGTIEFGDTVVNYNLMIKGSDKGQDRRLVIDGKKVSLSKQDNLSFEDLHVKVYEDLDKGITPIEAIKSIKLIEALKE